MKKSLLFLLLPLTVVELTGCVKYNGQCKNGPCSDDPTTSESTSSGEPGGDITSSVTSHEVEPGVEVNFYLNLGVTGKYNGNVGQEYPEVFLDYAIKLSGKSGDPLPGKDIITSSVSGASFDYWVLNGTQDRYDVIPSITNAVLVAVFTSGGSGGGSSDVKPSAGYGFLFEGGEKWYVGTEAGKDPYSSRDQWLVSNATFVEGEKFQLYDFGNKAGWTEPLDPYSLGGSETNPTWTTYLSKGDTFYTVLKTFTSSEIYIKLRYEDNIIYFK